MNRSRATILVVILISAAIAFQGLLGNIAANQLQEWLGPWARYVPMAFLLITVGIIGYTVRDQLAGVLDARGTGNATGQAERHRRAMLEKVRLIWIDGVLKTSLYQETVISLGMQPRPQAVTPPRGMVIQRNVQSDQPLPPNIRIVDVFDAVGGALLILGAPGVGKTTLLLELTCDLLDRAVQDTIVPIPVVFPLTSWAERRLPLAEWLADELNKRYDVGRSLARAWIAHDAVLPLLDGLDEVAQPHRAACVEAINTYRQEHGLVPLVVSSRIADYDELTVKLRLHGAILVQPLTREQVKAYLRQISLRVAPSSTSSLWDLLNTPLMLNIAALTYAGQDGQHLSTDGTPEAQRNRLFAAYIARMFESRPASQRFPQDRTLHWLAWLAWQMQHHNQTVLYLEHLQPDWLPTRSARWHYALLDRVGGGLMVGLVLGLSVWLGGGPIGWQKVGLGDGLVAGLVAGLVTGLFGGEVVQRSPIHQGVAYRILSTLLGGIVIGLAVGLLWGVNVWLDGGVVVSLGNSLSFWVGDAGVVSQDGQVWAPVVWLGDGLADGLIAGLFGALAGVLVGGPHIRSRRITVVESLRWSWQQAWRSMLIGLLWGLLWGLDVSSVGAHVFVLDDGEVWRLLPRGCCRRILGLGDGLVGGLADALVWGLLWGLVFALVGGITGSSIEQKMGPNQGIRRSGRNALVVGLVYGIVLGLIDRLVLQLGDGLDSGLLGGLLGGLVLGLANGGYAYLSHAALRLVLCQKGAMPRAYVSFLDENAQRILLRNVGGGYIFIHRLLLDYFAKQYQGPETRGN